MQRAPEAESLDKGMVVFKGVFSQDQSLAMAQSEDEKRKEVADRFQSGINEIQTQLNDYLEKNNKLREENQMLADKLQKFIADHEKREEYVQKVIVVSLFRLSFRPPNNFFHPMLFMSLSNKCGIQSSFFYSLRLSFSLTTLIIGMFHPPPLTH